MTIVVDVLKITEMQFNFIRSLAPKRLWVNVLNGQQTMVVKLVTRANEYADVAGTINRKLTSNTIDALLQCKVDGKAIFAAATPVNGSGSTGFDAMQHELKDLPLSKYAIMDATGTLFYYEVVQRKNGTRWVNRLVGAPGDWKRQFMNVIQSREIAKKLAVDPKAAGLLYCATFTRCCACDAPLSNGKSIEQAMGPVCIKKFN